MGSLFGSTPEPTPLPDPVVPKPLPPAPVRSDAQTESLADAQRRKFATASGGRASTFLTSGGLTDSTSAVRFLGGAKST